MNALTDVLQRLQRAPLGTLVAELRDLHERGGGPVPAGTPSPSGTPPALEPVLGLLRRASAGAGGDLTKAARGPSNAAALPALPATPPHRNVQPAPRDVPHEHAASDGDGADDRGYALLREHFGRHERELRHHARLTDRILSQLSHGETVSAPPQHAPLQQEVRVLCTAGGTSGGCCLLRNELDRPLRVTLRAHPPRSDGAEGLRVACAPNPLVLDAGEEAVVRIRVDLADCTMPSTGEIELVIDAVADEQVLQKIWLSIVVARAAQPDGGEAAR